MERIINSRNGIFLLITLAALLLCMPLLWLLKPNLSSSDLNMYLVSYLEFSKQFWNGDLYPRWLYNANAGLGAPVFVFYGPLTAYLFSVLDWLSPWDPHGYARFTLLFFIAKACSGMLCYTWLKEQFDHRFSAIAALCYTVLPYKIFPMYVQSGLPQFYGHVCMMLMLLGTHRLIHQKSSGWLLLLGTSLMILTHLPSLLTFAWVPFLYALCLTDKTQWKKHMLTIAVIMILSALITAFYWVPFWLNLPFVQGDRFIGPGRVYTYMYFTLINDYIIVPYYFIVLVAIAQFRNKTDLKEHLNFGYFIFFTLIVLVVMVTPLSIPILKVLPFLESLQFPARFYNVFIIPIAICSAYLIYKKSWQRLPVYIYMVMLAFSFSCIFIFMPHDKEGKFEYTQSTSFIYAPEYCPRSTATEFCSIGTQQQYYPKVPTVLIEQGSALLSATASPETYITTRLKILSETAQLQWRWRYFPGMELTDHMRDQKLPIYPNGANGLVRVTLPRGEYDLTLTMGALKGERMAFAISVFTLLIIGFYAYKCRKQVSKASILPLQ